MSTANQTSAAGEVHIKKYRGVHHRNILEALSLYGPMTDYELWLKVGIDSWNPQFISARRSELVDHGRVKNSGLVRNNPRTKCEMVVWQLGFEKVEYECCPNCGHQLRWKKRPRKGQTS